MYNMKEKKKKRIVYIYQQCKHENKKNQNIQK